MGRVVQEGSNRFEKAKAGLLRFQGRRRTEVRYLVMCVRDYIGDIDRALAHLGPQLSGVALLDVGPNGLDPGPVDTIEPPV